MPISMPRLFAAAARWPSAPTPALGDASAGAGGQRRHPVRRVFEGLF